MRSRKRTDETDETIEFAEYMRQQAEKQLALNGQKWQPVHKTMLFFGVANTGLGMDVEAALYPDGTVTFELEKERIERIVIADYIGKVQEREAILMAVEDTDGRSDKEKLTP